MTTVSPVSRGRYVPAACVAFALALGLSLASPLPAMALSEIQREDGTPPATSDISKPEQLPPPAGTQAAPDPKNPTGVPPAAASPLPGAAAPEAPAPAGDEQDGPATGPAGPGSDLAPPVNDPAAPVPPIEYDLSKLPEPVRRMHDLVVQACKSGDIEKLRPLLGTGQTQTQISFGEVEGDPIAFLKTLSGDPEGNEILAIIEEVLSAGYVHLDIGTDEELYVWPYFFAVPLEKLTPPQKVELFKIITGGDFEEMKAYGGYTFYRVGITPQGEWAFFVAGS